MSSIFAPASPFTATSPVVWPLSATDAHSLRARARTLHEHVSSRRSATPHGVARALSGLSTEDGFRAVVLGAGRDELIAGLRALAAGEDAPSVVTGTPVGDSVVFLFPGQGSQWAGMALDLHEHSPVFSEAMAECAAALMPFTGWSVLDVLRGTGGAPRLEGANVVQPALFAVMVSLVRLYEACGVQPAALLGHSLGEVVCACLSNALSYEDSARVVALWSKAQARVAGRGEMVFVMLPEAQVRARLGRWAGRLGIAAVNGPQAVLVSGDADAAEELLNALLDEEIYARKANVGLAAHSPHIDEIIPTMREDLAPIQALPPKVPVYSATYGRLLDGEPMDHDHWCRNLRETVWFQRAVESALADGHRIFVEVSPHPVFAADIADTVRRSGVDAAVGETLRRGEGGAGRFLTALAEVFVRGANPDWTAVLASRPVGPAEPLPASW